MVYGELQGIAAAVWFFFIVSVLIGAGEIFWLFGSVFDWLRANQTTGLKGSAGLIRSLRELKKDLIRKHWGPYWGVFGKSQEVMADFESVAVTCGTTGSGKSVGTVVPNALSIHESKCILDFKTSLTCMLSPALKKRGENVRILNFANLNTHILGDSDCYNPTSLILDCFKRKGGLLEVDEILGEMVHQIYPEPENNNGSNDNEYFRNGSRSLIHFAIMLSVILDGEKATLGDAAQLLKDEDALLKQAQWVHGSLEYDASQIPEELRGEI